MRLRFVLVITVFALPFGAKAMMSPDDFLRAGYEPRLPPTYVFPLKKQSLNACYFFAVRNILKEKYGIGIYVSSVEKAIGKDPKRLSTAADQRNFLNAVHAKVEESSDIGFLFDHLRDGDPVAISYMLAYRAKDGSLKTVPHVAAAYSFDADGIWVAETVSNSFVRVPYGDVFAKGKVRYKPLRAFTYVPKDRWTEDAKKQEREKNFLEGE